MKVKVVETFVKESIVDIGELDELAKVFKASMDALDARPEPAGLKGVGRTVLEVLDDNGGSLVIQRGGQLCLMPKATRVFKDCADEVDDG